ncbi:4-carboxymuconolactone decarboxylase [Ruicaihuangia caeni]|uniref:4-carboxymuconolactone decarboxylase n=1 Tax=Ruicaihuangia caeni TaxID=3042517 RepID=UPI003BF4AD59
MTDAVNARPSGDATNPNAHLHTLSDQERYEQGMKVRREVLGDAHVDRATDAITDITRDFQSFITRTAWGEVWSRPGLDRRMRSACTLTALIANSHLEELAMHVRSAITNGLTRDELVEIFLQSAIYCSIPNANNAFKVLQTTLAELDAQA